MAPTKWKRALILRFVNRARIIASTHKIYKQEITNLNEKLNEDFKVVFTKRKVSNYFSNKDKTPHELKSNVVYEYK